MPAPVVIVVDDDETRESALDALLAASYDVAAFADPMVALDAVEKDSRVRVLVASIDFGTGQLNGVALVLMLRHKQIAQDGKSELRGVFIGPFANGRHAKKEGDFVPMPIDPQVLVDAVGRAFSAT